MHKVFLKLTQDLCTKISLFMPKINKAAPIFLGTDIKICRTTILGKYPNAKITLLTRTLNYFRGNN